MRIAYASQWASAKLLESDGHVAPGPGEILMSTELVGFCGTDREIVRQGGIAVPPEGEDFLVLGHEAVGTVIETGPGVEQLKAGDRVVPMVRLSCGKCSPCLAWRNDYCLTGDYLEFGITRLHGFASPHVVVPEHAAVPVASGLGNLAVLGEPVSIVEKTMDEAASMLGRIPGRLADGPAWGKGLRALVTGAGSVGILTVYVLTGLGFEVEVVDLRDEKGLAAQLVGAAGAAYKQVGPADASEDPLEDLKQVDLAIEATGDPLLAFELLGRLAPGGVLMWVGVSGEEKMIKLDAGTAVLRAVLGHHAVVSTVNSSRAHYEKAVADLAVLKDRPRFGEIITEILPPERFEEAIWPAGEAIKQAVAFS